MGKCGVVAELWDSCAVMAYLCHSGLGYLGVVAYLCDSCMGYHGVVVNLWDFCAAYCGG